MANDVSGTHEIASYDVMGRNPLALAVMDTDVAAVKRLLGQGTCVSSGRISIITNSTY